MHQIRRSHLQLCKHECRWDGRLHRYLLVQNPHFSHLSLVVLAQPPHLLAGLLHVVVLPDQLDVVLPHGLQLLFQLGLLARQAALQRTEEGAQPVASASPAQNIGPCHSNLDFGQLN